MNKYSEFTREQLEWQIEILKNMINLGYYRRDEE